MELTIFGTKRLMYRQPLNVSMIASIIRKGILILHIIASKKENILLIALSMNAKLFS